MAISIGGIPATKDANSARGELGRGMSLARAHMPLLCLLALQSVVALTALHNTAFEDEALYLYAGRQIAYAISHHVPLTDPYWTSFSGDPYFYPLAVSFLDVWGGLEAARLLSLVCMLGASVCVYWIGQHLFDRETAIFGTVIFTFCGSALFLADLATYDAPCLLLIALSLVVAVRAGTARTPLLALGIGPLLVLAFLNKYIAMLWVPSVVAVLAWRSLQIWGWRQAIVRSAIGVGSVIATVVLALLVLDRSFLIGLQASTLNRGIIMTAPRSTLAWEVVSLSGIGLALALIGCLLRANTQRVMSILLVGSALLAPAYHIYKEQPVSLNKHLAYGLVFAAPVAGYAVTRLVRRAGRIVARNTIPDPSAPYHWLPALALCLIIFLVGSQQAVWQFRGWGDTTGMTHVMRTLVRPQSGRYLAEDMEVARYYLQDVTADWQWTGPFWFEYTNAAGQHFSGAAAYNAALADGYFDVVELSYSVAAQLDLSFQHQLQPGAKYDLVAKVPYHDVYGNGYYWIWRKHVPGTASGTGYTAPGMPAASLPSSRAIATSGRRYAPGLAGI